VSLRRSGGKRVYWPGFAAVLALAALIALGVNYLTDIDFWACFGLLTLGIAMNGFISMFEE
jgi:hypothetical protein